MTRNDALGLAQRKANDWGRPYRVLRSTSSGDTHVHMVEQSDSYDSPKGWALVEVFKPQDVPAAIGTLGAALRAAEDR